MLTQKDVTSRCEHLDALTATIDNGRFEAICETCKRCACDDCAESWATCQSCGGSICENCIPVAASRKVSDTVTEWSPYRKTVHTRTERLCGPCATRQAEARKALIADLLEAADESVWLEEIVYDVESAIKRAKKDGDL